MFYLAAKLTATATATIGAGPARSAADPSRARRSTQSHRLRQFRPPRQYFPCETHMPGRARRNGGADEPRCVGVDLGPLVHEVCDLLRHRRAIEELRFRFGIG